MTDINARLMKMAGMEKVSAKTTLVVSIFNSQLQGEFPPNSIYSANISDRKQYAPFYINKFRIIGLIDSGADMSCMQESLLRKILPRNKWKFDQPQELISASGDTMTALGNLDIDIFLAPNTKPIQTTICIIPDIPNTPDFIFGMNSLAKGKAVIKTSGKDNKPELIFEYPNYVEHKVYHYSPTEQETCLGFYNLKPYETKTIDMELNPAAAVVRSDIILITSPTLKKVNIFPTRVGIEFDYKKDCYTAEALVSNLTSQHIKGHVWGHFEIITNKSSIPINHEDTGNLKRILKEHPFGREVLCSNLKEEPTFPFLTISKVSFKQNRFNENEDEKIIDFDPKNTIMRGEPDYTGEVEITDDLIDPKGIELPTQVFANAAEAINLDSYNEEIRPFIKEIFIDKYPEVVALHAIDAGDLSLTLGLTQIRLRPGEVLPRCKRIFHMSPTDTRHLSDICDLLIKFGYLIKTPMEASNTHLYGMASYLVTRSKPGTLGRLVVDYSPINSLIQSPANIIPDINNTLQFLSGKALYTSLDLKQAYLSLKVDEQSRVLSTFLTPTGSYQWTSVPTGMANSPAYWADASEKMIHSEPVLDKEGKPVYECKGVVKLKKSPLPFVKHYFDDILTTSLLRETFHETLILHFQILEQLIKRLAFHGSKISIQKSDFAKNKICFLGWYVSNNFVIADPRRIEKIEKFIFPESKKSMRSFLGLVNSLRRVIHLKILEDAHILTPLTSSTKPYKPTKEHREVFEKVKRALISQPLFNNLVDEKAPKYLWVDASTGSGVVGAVLAQRKQGVPNEKVVPPCLDLDDPAHRIIFDRSLTYEPVKVYDSLPITLPKPTEITTISPDISERGKYHNFTEENIHDSFFLSAASILAVYNCKPVQKTTDLRELAVKEVKKGVLGLKLRDFQFNNNYMMYKDYLENFKRGLVGIDENFFLIEAFAIALYRPVILISTLKQHQGNPILKFNNESTKPPLIFAVYKNEGKIYFMPFFFNKNVAFILSDLYHKIEIIAYCSKTIPDTMLHAGILTQELVAILFALKSLNRFLSSADVTLLTDSKCLYYLFNGKVQMSCAKTTRWCVKLYTDHQNVKVRFVKSAENLADFLTREGLPKGDLEKYDLKSANVLDFFDELPKEEFTLSEWAQYCQDHPEFLTINRKEDKKRVYTKKANPTEEATIKKLVLSIRQGLENIKDIVTPLEILKERLSRAEIIRNQKREFQNIYTQCLSGENFEYVDEHE